MNSKAQVQQIFVYIVALLILGLIFIFGYRAFATMRENMEEAVFLDFKKKIEIAIHSSMDYGDVKIQEFRVGGKFQKICFVDTTTFIDNEGVCQGPPDGVPLICQSWKGGSGKTAYLVPPSDIEIETGSLAVDPVGIARGNANYVGSHCFDINNGRFRIRMEGKGDHVLISIPPPIT